MKRKLVVLFAILSVLGLGIAEAGSAHALTYYTMELESAAGAHTGWCINNPHGTTTPGVQQELWTCSGGNYTGYAIQESDFGDSNWYQIETTSGLCLSGQGGGNGHALLQETCNGSANQALCYDNYSGSGWPVEWVFTNGQAIGDHNDTQVNGNPIVTWQVNFSNSEAWDGPGINLRFACTSGDIAHIKAALHSS